MKTKKKVTIIGGGFSGLVQAYYLIQAGYHVKVIEKQNNLGGLLGTETKGDFLMEKAANAFLANQALEKMSSTIGVSLIPKQRVARRRYVYRAGEMKQWPLSVKNSLPLIGFFAKKKWKNNFSDTETLREWGVRSAGEDFTDFLLEPAMQGVYATSSDQLNASLILESLNRKVKKGKLRGSVAPERGMGQWVEGLEKYLRANGAEIELNQTCFNFNFSEPLILAVDLHSLRELAEKEKIDIHSSIKKTQSVSLTSVTIGVTGQKSPFPDGFGCLFPKRENFHSLGVLFNHCIFPNRLPSGFSETWILNDQNVEFSQMSQSALLRYILSDRMKIGGNWVEPRELNVSQWHQKIPLYDHTLKEFLQRQNQESSPFLLMGNYLGDLGLSKLLYRAQQNVEKIEGGYFG